VSVRDFATKAKPENFYHGFLSGVFTNCSDGISNYHSNSESGDGYADIVFKSADEDKAVIIELKVSENDRNMKETALNALKQIEDKSYAENYLLSEAIDSVYCYGICFYQKACYIEYVKAK
ncbi:MAG: PD-(D/E)XK nuclease domain-containing protein, partial [Succinivibrio sp.]